MLAVLCLLKPIRKQFFTFCVRGSPYLHALTTLCHVYVATLGGGVYGSLEPKWMLSFFCYTSVTYSRWTKYVEQRIERWKIHFDWLFKCPVDHDIILVRYEDLKFDLVHQVERILRFLHFPYRECKLLPTNKCTTLSLWVTVHIDCTTTLRHSSVVYVI